MRPLVVARVHQECREPVWPSRKTPYLHPSSLSGPYPRATSQQTILQEKDMRTRDIVYDASRTFRLGI